MFVHFSKLFVDSAIFEALTPEQVFGPVRSIKKLRLKGILHPDGHVQLLKPSLAFVKLLSDLNGSEDARDWLAAQLPNGEFDVTLVEGETALQSHRLPSSYAVDVIAVWVDFDQYRQALTVHQIVRKAFETHYELTRRLLVEAETLQSIEVPAGINEVIVSVEGAGMHPVFSNIEGLQA